jgi:hypothetical protein
MPRLRTVLIPIGALGVAVAGWTAIWHWGSSRAEDLIQRWLAAEAANGRVIECQSRTSGGYPFRLEINCLKPVVELRDETRPYRTFRFERLHVVSQIWSPGHVIAEATGPMVIVAENDPSVTTATWRLAQASAQLAIGGYDNSNSVIEQLAVTRDGQPLIRAERAEFHTRPNRTDPISVDIVTSFKQALFGQQTGGPVDAELQAIARKLLRTPSRPQILPLPQWQAAGGALDIVLLRVQQGAALGQAKGTIRLTPDGKPDGDLELRVANIDAAIDAAGLRPSLGPIAIGALAMASRPTDIDGRPARLFNLRANDGRLQIGPLRLALPSLLP